MILRRVAPPGQIKIEPMEGTVADRVSPRARSENMRRIRSKDTKPELRVRQIVHGLGYRYRLHVGALPGCPDLVFRKRKKIIFVHGCFWHQHRGCPDAHIPKSRTSYWLPKLERNVRRDRKNIQLLKRDGWVVLTIWACETEDERGIGRRLREFLS